MRTALLIVVALALVLSAGAAYAATPQEDGWAGLGTGGFETGLIGNYQTNWTQVGGNQTWQGWWDADDSRWVPVDGGGDDGLVVTAYVELYAGQTQKTEALFHWGKPPFAAMSAVLPGSIVSNHPCWVGIRKPDWEQTHQADASALTWDSSFPGWSSGIVTSPVVSGVSVLGDTIAAIPITFAMDVAGGGYYPMQWTGGAGSANWGWYSDGRLPVGTTAYNFKITATPNAYQADGKYTLDPQIIVVPDL